MENNNRIQEADQKSQVIFDGIRHVDQKTSMLLFSRGESVVAIHIERKTADYIMLHLSKISLAPTNTPVERGEDDASEF